MGVFLCYKSLVIRGQRAWHVKSSLRGMTLEYAWTWRPSLQSRPNRHARRKVRLVLMIYEINHIWTAEMKRKRRNDRRSEHNLCKCVNKPEKNSGLQRGLNPWPRDYRCDALPTELWSHWNQVHKIRERETRVTFDGSPFSASLLRSRY